MIVGTIDASAEAVSVGVLDPGDMMLMYGSTIFIIAITPERVRDRRLWYAPWLFPGQHGSMSGLATSGTLTHWFRDNLARDLDPATAMIVLAAEAETSPPGAKGLVLLPYFSGERTPMHDPHAKGVLFGLNLTHTRGDIYRALLEGIANGTNHIFETYVEAGANAEAPSMPSAAGRKTRCGRRRPRTSRGGRRSSATRRWARATATPSLPRSRWAMRARRTSGPGTRSPPRSSPTPRMPVSTRRQYAVFKDIYARTHDLMRRLDG